MLSRLQLVVLVAVAACKTPDVTFTKSDAGGDASNAPPPRCARLGFPSVPWPTTGTHPNSVAVGDVNGDGKPDLIVANSSPTVSVLLGNGNGMFQGKVDYPISAGATSVAIVDLSGDGYLDIVTTNSGTNNVSVLLGKGDGTFQGKNDFPTGVQPYSIAIADVSGDGKPDLVVTNLSAATASVLLGNGNGTFQAKADYPTGKGPTDVVVTDVSGDGKVDLVVSDWDFTTNTISILLGNGNGTFQSKVDYPTGSEPHSVAVADVNNDGETRPRCGHQQ